MRYIDSLYKCFQNFLDKPAIIYFPLDNSSEMPLPMQWKYRDLIVQAKNLSKKIYQHLQPKISSIPNPIIAVVSQDYPDYILALLAIWGLGGVYMPLDPNPEQQEALKNRLKLAGVTALITHKVQFKPNFFDDMPNNFVCLEWETLILESDDKDIPIDIKTTPADSSLKEPAYIYCSSGTQGAPKMIENTFEGLGGRVNSTADLLKINENSGVLGYCAPEFDASLLDILMTLSHGACLYPVTRKVRSEVALIEKMFTGANEVKIPITTMVVLPKILKELKNSPKYPSAFIKLKTMITMGEVCGIKVLSNWFKEIPDLKIMNGYGPTETTIAATVTELNRQAFSDWEENKYPDNKKEYGSLLPMGNPLTGVKLYFLDHEDPESPKILDAEEIKTLKKGKEVQLIIGGLGVGKYLEPRGGNENSEALSFYKQLNQEHFLSYDNSGNCWTFLESGNKKGEEKTRTISSQNIPFIKDERYYLTGDKILINANPSNDSSFYDLQFLGRIDRAVKKNGVFIELTQVEKTITEIWREIIEEVKVVSMNENNFAAFITPCPEKMTDFKTDEFFEKEFFKEEYRKKMAAKASRELPSFYFLLPHSEEKIDKIKSEQKFDQLLLKATRWMIPGNDNNTLDEIEKEISKIWQFYLNEEMESIPEFKKFIENPTHSSQYNRQSHFLYCGGDSFKLTSMIYKVWKTIKKEGNPPEIFIDEIHMNPLLGVIADGIKIYNGMSIHFNHLVEYPLIFLTDPENIADFKFIDQRGCCRIEIKTGYHPDLNQQIIKIIEEKIRSKFHAGPYLLLAEYVHKDLMDELAKVLAKSDLVKKKFLDSKNQEGNPVDKTIEKLTGKLINLSCQRKIEKWNSVPDEQEKKLINRWKFLKIPTKDIWYQSAAYSGKTYFLKKWCQKLWKEKEVWPIYFDVSGYHQKEVLDILFKKISFSHFEIEFLKTKKILILIDHYDRMKRYDIVDIRQNSDFKNWSNLNILVASRYLQCEYQDNQKLFSKKTDIITSRNQNYLIKKIFEEYNSTEKQLKSFEKYMMIEKKQHSQLKSVQIDLMKFIEFIQYFFQLESLKKINFEKSPWEDIQSIDSVNFHRGNPYFIIMRSLLLLKKKEKTYYFPMRLKQLLQIKNLYIDLPIADTKRELLNESPLGINKLLTLEKLKSDHPWSRFPDTLNTARKPVIAFFPLTGEVPEHYYKLFDKIGNFQPWIAFAMNVQLFSEEKNTMESMGEYYAKILTSLPGYYRPFILLGWSFGALLAFKVAEKLEAASVPVALVINIDCPPPIYLELKDTDKIIRARAIICTLAEQEGYCLDRNILQHIQLWTGEETFHTAFNLFGHIIQKLEKNGNHGSFKKMLQRAQIIFQAYCDCQFKSPNKLKATLIVAEAKDKTENLNQCEFSDWKNYTEKFEIKEFNGHHFNIPVLPDLAHWLRQKIQDLQQDLNPVLFSERLNNYYQSILPDQPFFVNLDGAAIDEKSAKQPLLEYCQNFIKKDSDRSLIIYGPAGSGKTTLLIEIARITKENLRVIYIRDSDNPKCVGEELLRAGFSSGELEEWKKIPSLVIIDSIEKFKQDINLWQLNQLDNWSNVKLILGYRYEGVKQDVYIGNSFLKDSKSPAKQIYCLPLTENQSTQLLTKLSPELPSKYNFFKQNHLSEEIFYHPLILTMLSMLLLENDFKEIQNSRFDFYHYFFTKQIQRSHEQIDRQEGIISGTDFEKISWNYALKFTEGVWLQRLSLELMLSDPATQQAKSALQAFLIKEESSFRFIHDTYFEFLFSIYLFGYLRPQKEKLLLQNINPWHSYSICTNYSLLNFLADQFNLLESDEKNSISTYITDFLQKKEEIGEYFSANILSFLAVIKQSFNHCEFKNISFRKANLTNAIFYQCTFEKVDFSNVVIHNNLFIECKFVEVNLDRVRIGSDYLIPIENAIAVSISPIDPNQLAYLTRQFYDLQEHKFSPQSFGIYDLFKNEFILKKQSSLPERHFESLDFDNNGDLRFISILDVDNTVSINSKKHCNDLRLFKFLNSSSYQKSWDKNFIKLKNPFSWHKPSLAVYSQYMVNGKRIYQITNEKIELFKTLQVEKFRSDECHYISRCGLLVDPKDPFSFLGSSFSGSIDSNIPKVISISNDTKYLAISWKKNPIRISVYETDTMRICHHLDLLVKKQVKNENIVGLAFNQEVSLLAALSKNNLITLFNLRTKKILTIIHCSNEMSDTCYYSNRIIHFANNYSLLTIANKGISLWDLSSYVENNLFNYTLPRSFTALTFNYPDESTNSLKLYAGDNWGNICELDILRGDVIKILCRFQDHIIHSMVISRNNHYLVLAVTHLKTNDKNLYFLTLPVQKYPVIIYGGKLSIIPEKIEFDEKERLVLFKCITEKYNYEITSNSTNSKYNLVLMSISTEQKVEASIIKLIWKNREFAGKPVLIEQGNKFILYGMSEKGEWNFTHGLNSNKFEKLNLKKTAENKYQLADTDQELYFINASEISENIYEEIKSKKAHTYGLEVRFIDRDILVGAKTPLPKNLEPIIKNILYEWVDYYYSNPFIILLGISFDLVCCRVDQEKIKLLWTSGTIGNNFYGSSFKSVLNMDYRLFKTIKKAGADNINTSEKDLLEKKEDRAGIPNNQIDRSLPCDFIISRNWPQIQRQRYVNPGLARFVQ